MCLVEQTLFEEALAAKHEVDGAFVRQVERLPARISLDVLTGYGEERTYSVDFLGERLDELGNDGEVGARLADDDVCAWVTQEAHMLHRRHDCSDYVSRMSTFLSVCY